MRSPVSVQADRLPSSSVAQPVCSVQAPSVSSPIPRCLRASRQPHIDRLQIEVTGLRQPDDVLDMAHRLSAHRGRSFEDGRRQRPRHSAGCRREKGESERGSHMELQPRRSSLGSSPSEGGALPPRVPRDLAPRQPHRTSRSALSELPESRHRQVARQLRGQFLIETTMPGDRCLQMGDHFSPGSGAFFLSIHSERLHQERPETGDLPPKRADAPLRATLAWLAMRTSASSWRRDTS